MLQLAILYIAVVLKHISSILCTSPCSHFPVFHPKTLPTLHLLALSNTLHPL